MTTAEDVFSEIGKYFVGFILMSVLVPLVFFPIAFLDAWAVVKVWRWFVVPIFHAPDLHVGVAVGLILLVRHLTVGVRGKDDRKVADRFITSVLSPVFLLLIAWIIKTWFFAL